MPSTLSSHRISTGSAGYRNSSRTTKSFLYPDGLKSEGGSYLNQVIKETNTSYHKESEKIKERRSRISGISSASTECDSNVGSRQGSLISNASGRYSYNAGRISAVSSASAVCSSPNDATSNSGKSSSTLASFRRSLSRGLSGLFSNTSSNGPGSRSSKSGPESQYSNKTDTFCREPEPEINSEASFDADGRDSEVSEEGNDSKKTFEEARKPTTGVKKSSKFGIF